MKLIAMHVSECDAKGVAGMKLDSYTDLCQNYMYVVRTIGLH